jgi:hypothetical protein
MPYEGISPSNPNSSVGDTITDVTVSELDARLDEELDQSFPASDPPTVTRDRSTGESEGTIHRWAHSATNRDVASPFQGRKRTHCVVLLCSNE